MAMNVQSIPTLSDRINQIRILTAEIINREILPNENTLWLKRVDGKIDELMSWTEIRQANDARKLASTNRSDLWYQQWCAAGLDPFEYLDWSEMDVLTGRTGTIHLSATPGPKSRLLIHGEHHAKK